MKKLFCIVMTLSILLLSSCTKSSKENLSEDNSSAQTSSSSSIDNKKLEPEENVKEESSVIQNSSENQNVSSSVSENTKETKKPNTSKQNVSSAQSSPSVYIPPAKNENPDNSYSAPVIVTNDASANDETSIADRIIDYLNDYHTAIGSSRLQKLSGLTEYAKFRSNQLTGHFAHDTNDERAAATALKYGQYVNPADFGLPGELYYTAYTSEAIANSGFHGSVDEVAKNFADMCRNSSDHWAYIGSSGFSYVGVGVKYYYGFWYVNISLINTTDFEK